MKYTYDDRIDLYVKDRITKEDAQRQTRTASAIIERLEDRPGIILADEVGMGKTFVALAVACSIAIKRKKVGPVVIMVPPSLRDKWPRDFELFRERCLPKSRQNTMQYGRADRAVEFLKLLDDPPERQKSIIFLTHGAMYRGLSDRWVQLAMIQRALYRRRNAGDIKRSLYRNLGSLLGMKWVERRDESIWEKLLDAPTQRWLKILKSSGIDPENDNDATTDDDPVPELVVEALADLDVSPIFDQLKTELPRRQTKHFESHMAAFRRTLRSAMRELWASCIRQMDYRLPLLVLDEAHHLKNPATQLASLFQEREAKEDADLISRGPFAGVFERMLFLTATPFQLGHHELCSVINRFSGISWRTSSAPPGGKRRFETDIRSLAKKLDRAQETAVRFEQSWGKLDANNAHIDTPSPSEIEMWWKNLVAGSGEMSPVVEAVLHRYERTRSSLQEAEKSLKPWVIRHMKPREIQSSSGSILRREYKIGSQILDDRTPGSEAGISIGPDALMPFLVACRLTTCMPDERPVFAEGLASSYEAFLHTRSQRKEAALDDDDEQVIPSINDRGEWYIDQLERLIPKGNLSESRQHPKVSAVVSQAINLWKRREKVLIFCHYIATGRILRQHISSAIEASIIEDGAISLDIPEDQVEDRLELLGRRFFDTDSPARRACDKAVLDVLKPYRALKSHRDDIVDIVRRYVRTPSFLVRYFPLKESTIDEAVMDQVMATRDDSRMSFRELLDSFFNFLTYRCSSYERNRYLEALDSIQTGSIGGQDVTASFDESELQGDSTRARMLPNVRLVNGATARDTRQKLMLTFNTPFFPEILIASSVMAEGVDLHLNCRYVLHHDLCWNPSTLEQRNGRVDRIGGKVEQASAPIHIYLPFIAQTQDEKMYRVVRDRERWFKVVMGEKMTLSASNTDKIAERLPLPESIGEELAFDLRV
jgi:hypothetical protein